MKQTTKTTKPRRERIIESLKKGPRTRSEIYDAIGGGPLQKLDGDLRRLLAERRIERVEVGTYALKGAS